MRTHHAGMRLRRAAALTLAVPAVTFYAALGAPAFAEPGSTVVKVPSTEQPGEQPSDDGPSGPEVPPQKPKPTPEKTADAAITVDAPATFVPGKYEKITLTPTIDTAAPLTVRLVSPKTTITAFDAPGWSVVTHTQVVLELISEATPSPAPIEVTVRPLNGPERVSELRATVIPKDIVESNRANNRVGKNIPVAGADNVVGHVWHDADADGQQDESEAPVPGATAVLLKIDGDDAVPVATAVTRTKGNYRFDYTPLGTYTVAIAAPDGSWHFTKPDVGPDATDSDVVELSDEDLAGARGKALAKAAEEAPEGAVGVAEPFTLDGSRNHAIDAGLVKASAQPSPPAPAPSSPAPDGGDGGGTLPTTGAGLTAVLGAGAALLAGGAALTIAARRRRSAGQTAA